MANIYFMDIPTVEPYHQVTGPEAIFLSVCYRNIMLLMQMLSKPCGYYSGFANCVRLQCQHLKVQ